MSYDALMIATTAVTKTATFNTNGVDLKVGSPIHGMHARVLLTSFASVGTAGSVLTFTVASSDDSATWTTDATYPAITGTTAAQTAEILIPFITKRRYARVTGTLSPSSGTPAYVFSADISLGHNRTN